MKKGDIVLILLFLFVTSFSFGQHKPELTVKIDPRFEAISIFYTLAVADSFNIEDRPTASVYYKDVKNYFGKYKDHEALTWYRNLEGGDGYDIPSFGIYLTNNPPFHIKENIENKYVRSCDPNTFIIKLNTFLDDTDGWRFIQQHQNFYKQVALQVKKDVEKSNILPLVQSFFGNSNLKETVIYLDILNNSGNNAIVPKSSDAPDKCLIRLAYLSDTSLHLTDGSPVVFTPHLNVIAHESSHVYLKDFILQYEGRLHTIRNLFLETTGGRKLEEKEWKNELDELLVRVCVARILDAKYGKEAGLREIQKQAERYKWATELYQFMNKYENDRNKYKSINSFYPELIKFFESQV